VNREVTTIGYQGATIADVVQALKDADVQLLVDVRALAMSRRPGFAKSRLAANLAEGGIEYLHLRGLGTPADGRAAARAGHHDEMQRIFTEHMKSDVAQTDLATLADIVGQGKRVCLLCFEADPQHCHRRLVAEALGEVIKVKVTHLHPDTDD
jgi:uncharacterized protein (DUF488 family)